MSTNTTVLKAIWIMGNFLQFLIEAGIRQTPDFRYFLLKPVFDKGIAGKQNKIGVLHFIKKPDGSCRSKTVQPGAGIVPSHNKKPDNQAKSELYNQHQGKLNIPDVRLSGKAHQAVARYHPLDNTGQQQ